MDFWLTDDEREFRHGVRDWVETKFPKAEVRAIDDAGVYPDKLWEEMSQIGLHGIGIAEEYGGEGGDVVTQLIVAQELSRTLAGYSSVWGVPSFAGAKSVGVYGTEEQKQRFLPGLAQGRLRFAIAITEPDGGTDLLSNLRTKAVRTADGWTISGQKMWSTGAHVADYLLVLAKSEDASSSRAMTLFAVPTDSPGIRMQRIPKLGYKALWSNEVFFDSVEVADDMRFGEPGEGWRLLVSTLNNERIMAAGFANGMLDGVLQSALGYMHERRAFGKLIGEFQILQHYIADIKTWQAQSELLALKAARMQSAGMECGVEATMAKLVASEYANKAADMGIQIMGGMGYSMETDMQQFWRDSRLLRIAPITTEMAKNMIAQSCGLPRTF